MWSLSYMKATLWHWPREAIRATGLNCTRPNRTIAKIWALPPFYSFNQVYLLQTPVLGNASAQTFRCLPMPWPPDLSNVLPVYLRSLYSLDLLTSYLCPWTPATPDKSLLLLPSSVLYFRITWGGILKICPWRKGNWEGKVLTGQGRVVPSQDADLTGLVWSSTISMFLKLPRWH